MQVKIAAQLSRVMSRLFFTRAPSSLPEGYRIYAIGDVHGRLDLLERLVDLIARDDADRLAAKTSIVLLGDLINKGPDTRGVLEFVANWSNEHIALFILKGNHEDVLLGALAGDHDMCRAFHDMGGRETVLSYGIAANDYAAWPVDELPQQLARVIPARHRTLIAQARPGWTCGDYRFAHAGWQDGLDLHAQSEFELFWQRTAFQPATRVSRTVLVHGHANMNKPVNKRHSICVDTTAHASGRLTAVALEGATRRFLETQAATLAR